MPSIAPAYYSNDLGVRVKLRAEKLALKPLGQAMDPPRSQTLGWAKGCAWTRLGVDWYGLYLRKGEPVFLLNWRQRMRVLSRRASAPTG